MAITASNAQVSPWWSASPQVPHPQHSHQKISQHSAPTQRPPPMPKRQSPTLPAPSCQLPLVLASQQQSPQTAQTPQSPRYMSDSSPASAQTPQSPAHAPLPHQPQTHQVQSPRASSPIGSAKMFFQPSHSKPSVSGGETPSLPTAGCAAPALGWQPSSPSPASLLEFRQLCDESLLLMPALNRRGGRSPEPRKHHISTLSPVPHRRYSVDSVLDNSIIMIGSGVVQKDKADPCVRRVSSPYAGVDPRSPTPLAEWRNEIQTQWQTLTKNFEAWTGTDFSVFSGCVHAHPTRGGERVESPDLVARPLLPTRRCNSATRPGTNVCTADDERGRRGSYTLAPRVSRCSWLTHTSPSTGLGEAGGMVSGLTARRAPIGAEAEFRAAMGQGNCPDAVLPVDEAREMLVNARTSLSSLKGNKKEIPNQDRAVYLCNSACDAELLAVFDGHGPDGHGAAEICAEGLPKLLFRALATHDADGPGGLGAVTCQRAASRAFVEMHNIMEALTVHGLAEGGVPTEHCPHGLPALDARSSGTTATVVLLLPNHRALLAHVGDSRAVLGTRRRGTESWHAVEVTRDHKPERPDERMRVEASGAQVLVPPSNNQNSSARIFTPNQPWSMINMTRSLGDLHAHTQGLTPAPEAIVVEPLWNFGSDEAVLIIASDGVWDVLNLQTAVELVASSPDPAAVLTREAYSRWAQRGLPGGYSDDITAVVKFL